MSATDSIGQDHRVREPRRAGGRRRGRADADHAADDLRHRARRRRARRRPGHWSLEAAGYAYAWLRCNANGRLCTPIPRATATSYKPVAADAGHTLVAEVVANGAGRDAGGAHGRHGADRQADGDGGRGGRRSRQSLALAAVCVVLFLTFLDNTIVSVALADMQTSLKAGVSSLQWIVDGYMLAFAALMLTGGTLGDLLGRKKVLLGGVALFCAGALVLARSHRARRTLIAGRVVMGVGAAACEPGTLSLIRQLYPDDRERARALGVWTSVSGISLAAGRCSAASSSALAGWRGIFWFNVGLGLVALAAAAWTLDGERRSRRAGRSTSRASSPAPSRSRRSRSP